MFNAYSLNLSHQILVGFIFVYQKSLNRTFKTVFQYKITGDLNSQRLLCIQKAGVKCSY